MISASSLYSSKQLLNPLSDSAKYTIVLYIITRLMTSSINAFMTSMKLDRQCHLTENLTNQPVPDLERLPDDDNDILFPLSLQDTIDSTNIKNIQTESSFMSNAIKSFLDKKYSLLNALLE